MEYISEGGLKHTKHTIEFTASGTNQAVTVCVSDEDACEV